MIAAPQSPRADDRLGVALIPFGWLALVLAAWLAIDAIGQIGPFDRAKLGGAIGMPLTLLLPTVTGAVARVVGPGWRRLAIVGGIALAAALLIVEPFASQLAAQCSAAGQAVPIGGLITLGVSVALAVMLSTIVAGVLWRAPDGRRRIVAAVSTSSLVLLIVGAVVVVVTFTALFSPAPASSDRRSRRDRRGA